MCEVPKMPLLRYLPTVDTLVMDVIEKLESVQPVHNACVQVGR